MDEEQVSWKNLVVGGSYYALTTGYHLGNNKPTLIVVTDVQLLGNDSAMIYADEGRGYAVGGVYEGPIGPKNRFWPVCWSDELVSLSARLRLS